MIVRMSRQQRPSRSAVPTAAAVLRQPRGYRPKVAFNEEVVIHAVSVYLDHHWDPIGVFSYDDDLHPPPGDEYRTYAEHVVRMLRAGESAASIGHYLNRQATLTMEVGPSGTEPDVAKRLHRWYATGSDPAALDP